MRKILVIFSLLCAAVYGESTPIESCEALIAPKQELMEKLIELINAEKTSVKIAVYTLTNRKVAQALLDAKKRGVSVEVIIDGASRKPKFTIGEFIKADIPVFIFEKKEEKKGKAHMHHKFCLLGNRETPLIWTGSFSPSYSANHDHRENVLIISLEKVFLEYEKEFESLKNFHCKRLK